MWVRPGIDSLDDMLEPRSVFLTECAVDLTSSMLHIRHSRFSTVWVMTRAWTGWIYVLSFLTLRSSISGGPSTRSGQRPEHPSPTSDHIAACKNRCRIHAGVLYVDMDWSGATMSATVAQRCLWRSELSPRAHVPTCPLLQTQSRPHLPTHTDGLHLEHTFSSFPRSLHMAVMSQHGYAKRQKGRPLNIPPKRPSLLSIRPCRRRSGTFPARNRFRI